MFDSSTMNFYNLFGNGSNRTFSSSSLGSEILATHTAPRIGAKYCVLKGANVRITERIFKIIKERDIEIDSSDDEENEQQYDCNKIENITRKCHVDKEMYKSLFKKTRKIVKSAFDN